MPSCSDTIVDGLCIIGIVVLGLLLTLFLLPPLEASRGHTRKAQAWITTRQLAAESDEARRELLLAEPDPWGQPYQVFVQPDGSIRAVSSGPNMTSPEAGFDEDDIYSDMPRSPNAAADLRHSFRFLFALGAGATLWIVLSLKYVGSRCREP